MSTPAGEPASPPFFRVRWPDGGIYVNGKGETRLTEEEARAIAPRIGGTWRRVSGQED